MALYLKFFHFHVKQVIAHSISPASQRLRCTYTFNATDRHTSEVHWYTYQWRILSEIILLSIRLVTF